MFTIVAALAPATAALAVDDTLPFGDQAPRYDATADRVRLAAWGVSPRWPANLAQVAAGSRRSARQRALRALHGWVDAAMRGQVATPPLLTALHDAAEHGLREVGVRHLADGTVVLCVELDGARLREVLAERGLPWAR